MKLITLAAASLAMAIAAPALAQNVEKVGTAGGRILTAAKVKAGATTVYLSGNLASPATPGGSVTSASWKSGLFGLLAIMNGAYLLPKKFGPPERIGTGSANCT